MNAAEPGTLPPSATRAGSTEQPLPAWQRGVLKVGSSLLAADDGGLSTRHALGLAQFISACHAAGREVVLVSSGAVAAGRAVLRERGGDGTTLAARQALAAVGQTRMLGLWQRFFDRPAAQVLLTHDDLRNRRRYLNARATLRELLRLNVLPVVNENDTVAVEELKLGDNDNLAAIVAALVDADVLFIASDVDGLFSANPRTDPDAVLLNVVEQVTAPVLALAGGVGSAVGTGGMRTKLEAAAKAAAAGIPTFLFNGTDAHTLRRLAQGTLLGTLVHATGSRQQARKHWLRHAPAEGGIVVDAGAARALVSAGASLLPGGIVAVSGEFRRGDLVEIFLERSERQPPLARGITQYAAGEVRRVAGRHTREIEALLGYTYGDSVVHRDDMVGAIPPAGPGPAPIGGVDAKMNR